MSVDAVILVDNEENMFSWSGVLIPRIIIPIGMVMDEELSLLSVDQQSLDSRRNEETVLRNVSWRVMKKFLKSRN